MIDRTRKHRSRLRAVGVVSAPQYRRITAEQLKAGYLRFAGVTPSHHQFTVIEKREDGTYVVLDPDARDAR